MEQYYIDVAGTKEGPHDLITIMRRIRTGKIDRSTLIYTDQDAPPVRADHIADIVPFFQSAETPAPAAAAPVSAPIITPVKAAPVATPAPTPKKPFVKPKQRSLLVSIRVGWQFVIEHNVMTVYAGGLMLLGILLATGLTKTFGLITGGAIAWCIFLPLHHLYLLFALRFHRGQPVGSDFINRQFLPIMGTFVASSLVIAVLVGGGALLLLIPGLLMMIFFAFVPFLILDRHQSVVQAIKSSTLLVGRAGPNTLELITLLVLLHLLFMILIIPMPLTLPIFAGALSDLYEELSTI